MTKWKTLVDTLNEIKENKRMSIKEIAETTETKTSSTSRFLSKKFEPKLGTYLKYKDAIETIDIPFDKLKFEYIYDESWGFRYADHNIVVDFYKDDNGINIVEQFLRKIKGQWQDIEPTEKQIEIMFKMLDDVEPRKSYD